jgi:hypothetical protein
MLEDPIQISEASQNKLPQKTLAATARKIYSNRCPNPTKMPSWHTLFDGYLSCIENYLLVLWVILHLFFEPLEEIWCTLFFQYQSINCRNVVNAAWDFSSGTPFVSKLNNTRSSRKYMRIAASSDFTALADLFAQSASMVVGLPSITSGSTSLSGGSSPTSITSGIVSTS